MLQPRMLGTVALLGLLAGTAASADDRRHFRDDYYRSSPQVRLGVDVIWGGYGYAPPRPPVVWYPAYYANDRYYDHDRDQDQGYGRGHRKHKHRSSHWDDCDD